MYLSQTSWGAATLWLDGLSFGAPFWETRQPAHMSPPRGDVWGGAEGLADSRLDEGKAVHLSLRGPGGRCMEAEPTHLASRAAGPLRKHGSRSFLDKGAVPTASLSAARGPPCQPPGRRTTSWLSWGAQGPARSASALLPRPVSPDRSPEPCGLCPPGRPPFRPAGLRPAAASAWGAGPARCSLSSGPTSTRTPEELFLHPPGRCSFLGVQGTPFLTRGSPSAHPTPWAGLSSPSHCLGRPGALWVLGDTCRMGRCMCFVTVKFGSSPAEGGHSRKLYCSRVSEPRVGAGRTSSEARRWVT